jgi:hypothetical protein
MILRVTLSISLLLSFWRCESEQANYQPFTDHSIQATYGFEIQSTNDPYVKMAGDALRVAEGLLPGAFLVDAIPIRE